jgi:16S rRNA (guanine527-N7)-methyltransferase
MITEELQSFLAEIVVPFAGNQQEVLLERYNKFIELLRSRTREANLTGIRDPNEIAIHVIGDALAPLADAPVDYMAEPPEELLDVGTGAGIPGLVYAMLWPETSVVLLESQKKRIEFLHDAIEHLELDNVKVLEGRAETHAHELIWRERFDLVTSRALAPLPIALELCLPFLALEGYFLTFKGATPNEEVKEADFALSKLGGGPIEAKAYHAGPGAPKRSALWSEKTGLTPDRYPRKEGIPAKRPLRGSR